MERVEKDNKLYAIIFKRKDFGKYSRWNICDDYLPLQIAGIYDKAVFFEAHRHLLDTKITDRTAEVWIVMQGVVRFTLFDENKVKLYSCFVNCGDGVVTFDGYHEYEMITSDTFVYEIKSGPYKGREKDKVMMNE